MGIHLGVAFLEGRHDVAVAAEPPSR